MYCNPSVRGLGHCFDRLIQPPTVNMYGVKDNYGFRVKKEMDRICITESIGR